MTSKGNDIATRLDALPPKRRRLLERLQAERRQELRAVLGERERWPLSAAQRRLWFLARLAPARRDYVLAGCLRLEGTLQRDALSAALTAVLRRQPMLRARVGVSDEGEPYLHIVAAQTVELPLHEAAGAELARALADRPFALDGEPLLRLALCSTGTRSHELALVAHHLICDGGSLAVFATELSAHYRAICETGAPAPLHPLPVNYGDFARWEEARLASPELEEQRAWWLARLAKGPPAPSFASGRGERAGARTRLQLDAALVTALDARARTHATTRFALLCAALMVALEAHAPRGEQWLGTPVAGRERPELEHLVGLFVNTLVVRAELDAARSLASFLRELGAGIGEALARAALPFERLVEGLGLARRGETPLLQAAISLQEPAAPFKLGPELEGSLEPVFCERVTLELLVVLRPQGEALEASFEYARASVDAITVARIAERFVAALRAFAAHDDAPLAPLLVPLAPARSGPVSALAPAADEVSERAPLSATQLAMWMGQRLHGDAPLYNQQLICTVDGVLDPDLLERAFASVVATNDALRTVIEVVDGVPCQRWRAPDGGPALARVELRPGPELDARAARLLERRGARRFELGISLVDSVLVRVGSERSYWCLTLHHLITDGRSFALILEQTAQAYARLAAAEEGADEPQASSMGAEVLRAAASPPRAGQRLERARSHWRALEPAPLPAFFGRRRQVEQTAVARVELELGAQRWAALRELCQRPPLRSLTPAMARTKLWLTLVAALVHRATGERELCIGVPLHRRSSSLAKRTVGALMVVCPVRLCVPPRASLVELAAAVDEAFGEGLRKLVGLDALRGDRRPYDVVLNYLELDFAELAGLPTRVEMRTPGHALDTLTVNVHDHGEHLLVELDLCAAVFDVRARARMGEELDALIEGYLAHPDARLHPTSSRGVHEPALLDHAAEAAPFVDARDTPWAAIEAQAARQPDAMAVSEGVRQLSYGALRERVRTLAEGLRARGLGPGDLICVALPRSLEQVLAVLAVGASGAAYLPVDPERSCVRARADLVEAVGVGVRIALVAEADRSELETAELELLTLPELAERARAWTGLAPCVPRSPAYYMFTSGSSAAPRAVIVELAGLVNHARWAAQAFGLGPGERVLQFASLAFDTAAEELFPSLIAGATLVLREAELVSPREFWLRCRAAGVSVLDLPTAYWHVLVREGELDPAALGRVRLVIIGGERAERDAVARWADELGDAAALLNTYGPTEATIIASAHALGPHSLAGARELPIGRPLSGVRLSLAPFEAPWASTSAGVPGELLIGGIGVAAGYAGLPGPSAARFVPDPHGPPGARRYRSGDRVGLADDGELLYHGRADRQLKVRGIRIEPSAIEARALALPQISAAAVEATGLAGSGPGSAGALPLLWLFMVAAQVSPPAAQTFAAQLAPPGVPLRGVWLDALPLTARGKLDRAALRARAAELLATPGVTMEHDGGADGVLAELRRLWAELLERDPAALTPDADFFALGGHSLLGAMLIARIERHLGVALPLRVLFDAPRLGDLARALSRSRARADAPATEAIRPRPPGSDTAAPLSSTQERLWFLDQLDPGNPTYNIPAAVELRGELDVAALARAFSALVARHEILRTTFVMGALGPEQRVAAPGPVDLPLIELETTETDALEAAIDARIHAHAGRRFALERGPLLALELLRCGPARHVLISNLHHIIADGWSVGVLVRELEACYAAACAGVEAELAPLPIQYADYAAWQRQRLAGPSTQSERAWWRGSLAGAPERLDLPLARARPAVERHIGARLPLHLDDERGRALAELARAHEATPFMAMLACFGLLLARVSGQAELCVGTPVAGRDLPELEGLIGCFVNTVVLRLDLTGAPSYVELLRRVRATCLDALAHRSLPFEAVVDELRPQRSLAHQPLFQVMFTFLNEPTRRALSERGALDWSLREFDRGGANRDLTMRLEAQPAGALVGHIEYNVELFDAAQITSWGERLEAIVVEVLADPQCNLVVRGGETREERRARARERRAKQRRGFAGVRASLDKGKGGDEPEREGEPRRERGGAARGELGLFRSGPLVEGRPSPLVLEARVGDLDLRAVLTAERARLLELAREHGGVLIRGLAPRRPETFGEDCRVLTPELMNYDEPSTPRTKLGEGIYTSTEYPAEARIMAHHEMAYASHWPRWLWFHCRQRASTGGESPVVDGERVRERIDPALRERFERLGVCYVRNYRRHLDLPWQRVFATQERARVEALCRAAGMQFEWTGDDGLRTRYRSPAVVRAPHGGLVWFNSAHMFHVCALEPEVRESLRALFDEAELPRHAYFGDGSPIPDEGIAHIRAIYVEEGLPLRWRAGDMLLLDNMRFAHGREPFTGERELLVTMAEQSDNRGLGDAGVLR